MKRQYSVIGSLVVVGILLFMIAGLGVVRHQTIAQKHTLKVANIIPQTGRAAEQLTRVLERIELPPNFRISLYALAPGARHLAVVDDVVFVGTRNTNSVWVITDQDDDFVADDVRTFAPQLSFQFPNGVCLSDDGTLFVAELNRVLKFPDLLKHYHDPTVEGIVVTDVLVPRSEVSRNHGARVCRIGPDQQLYIALGQPYNVSPPEKEALYNAYGIGGIIRMSQEGEEREVYAYGIRNSVGLDFNPANQELWFTDNQVDGMGDDIPPGELNRVTEMGQHFGFPWYGGGDVRTYPYQNSTPPADVIFPEVEMVAHAADLGMTFYRSDAFPELYHGGIFNAQHGSWNRTTPIGARVMFTTVNDDGAAGETFVFASGWLDERTGRYLGRPVDVAELSDGSLLVSDDRAGAIYRIWYEEPLSDSQSQ